MRCLTKWLLSSISAVHVHMYMLCLPVWMQNLPNDPLYVYRYMHMTTTWHCSVQNIDTHVEELYCPMCASVHNGYWHANIPRNYCWACRLFSCDACMFYVVKVVGAETVVQNNQCIYFVRLASFVVFEAVVKCVLALWYMVMLCIYMYIVHTCTCLHTCIVCGM